MMSLGCLTPCTATDGGMDIGAIIGQVAGGGVGGGVLLAIVGMIKSAMAKLQVVKLTCINLYSDGFLII